MPKKSKITKKPSLPGYNFGQADETLTKGAATAAGLKKEEPAAEMSAFNLKAIPEDAKGLKKMAKSEKGANQVKNFGYDPATAMKPGYQMNYKMVNKEGFQMAGNPTKIAAFQNTGKTTKETVKSEKVEKKTVPGGTETNYSGGGKFKNKKEKAWYDNQIKQRTDKGMSAEEAVQDYRNTFKIGEKKETKLPNKVVETVTKDPVYADKTMFNIGEQRERGQQSLLASRQSNREGLNKLVAQKTGLKTALKSNIDEVKNKSFDSRKDRRQAIREARQSKRQGMRSFRAGNFQGAQNVLNKNMIADTRGFDIGASDLARRQAMGIDKSVRYYDTQSALDKGVRAGGTYSDVARTSQASADFTAEITPSSSTNMLSRGETGGPGFVSSNFPTLDYKKNININSFSGNNMKKGNYMKPMQLSPKATNYFNKKNKK